MVIDVIAGYARSYAGLYVRTEDSDLFGSVLRENRGPLRRAEAVDRTRTLTVDMRIVIDGITHLLEVKTIHLGNSRYGPGPAEYNKAVEQRAARVPTERMKNITDTDRDVFGTPQGVVGPLQARLNTFPLGFTGVVTGAFGEWSASLVGLMKTIAELGAEKWMRRLDAPSPSQARSTLSRLMRADLGMRVARGHAQLIIERSRANDVGDVGMGARAWEPATGGARYAHDAWHHQQQQRGCNGGSGGCARGRPGRYRGARATGRR